MQLALLALASAGISALPLVSSLRITASSTERGGSRSYFGPETYALSNVPQGFMWATTKRGSDTYAARGPFQLPLDGEDDSDDDDDDDDDDYDSDDDDDDDDDSEARQLSVKPFKRHWTVQLDRRFAGGSFSNGIELSVDASARTFVRAMNSEDMIDVDDTLAATVVVRGDSRRLLDDVVDVVADVVPTHSSSSAAFRVGNRVDASATLLSGRLLIQIFLNTRHFRVASLNASGDSVVVATDDGQLLRGSNALLLAASGRASLFVSLASTIRTATLTAQASDASSLMLQSTASVSLAHLQMQQQQHATLAVVADRLATASVHAIVDSGQLCVHTRASSAASMVTADVVGDDGVLEWTPSTTTTDGGAACELLHLRVAGRNVHANMRGVQSQIVNATVDGVDAVAVVNAKTQLLYTASPSTRGVVYVGARPSQVIGSTGKLAAALEKDDAFVAASPCALATLARQFPLPHERAAFVSLSSEPSVGEIEPNPYPQQPSEPQPQPLHLPLEDIATATNLPLETQFPLSDPPNDDDRVFVNGSLHMLGSMPYVSVIVIFLASAWILHHLLECFDRRQRRHTYRSLDEPRERDDRVWI